MAGISQEPNFGNIASTKTKRTSVEIMTIEHEIFLWQRGILNLTDPVGLSRAVFFYFCKAFGVYSRNAIREIMREQFRFGGDEHGKFIEFVDFEKMDPDRMDDAPGHRVRRVIQYDDPANDHSVYKIMTTYISHIPAQGEFFRTPLRPTQTESFIPGKHFSNRPIGINLLSHYLSDMMKDAGFLKENFSTQSIKSAVLVILFRVGIDEEVSRQRTRSWWGSGRVSSATQATELGSSSTVVQSDRQKLVSMSRLFDPPTVTPHLRRVPRESLRNNQNDLQELVSVFEHQQQQSTESPHGDSLSPAVLISTNHPEIPSPVQISPPPLYRGSTSAYQLQEQGIEGEPSRWFSSEPAVQELDDQTLPKKPRLVSESPERESTARQGFVAMSGSVISSTAVPKQLVKSHEIKKEQEIISDDEDCCVIESSTPADQFYARQELSKPAPTKQRAVSSTAPPWETSQSLDKCPPGVRNQMQCLTNSEMKETSSRPPREGTSALSLAFKFAYEIDHNGEVAASREIRALHTTLNDEASNAAKRRLLPLNVVDSSGNDASERQDELPGFTIRLADFFPSISQRKIDIKDVVIRGSRGNGTDRLNVELMVAERGENDSEVQIVEDVDFK